MNSKPMVIRHDRDFPYPFRVEIEESGRTKIGRNFASYQGAASYALEVVKRNPETVTATVVQVLIVVRGEDPTNG